MEEQAGPTPTCDVVYKMADESKAEESMADEFKPKESKGDDSWRMA